MKPALGNQQRVVLDGIDRPMFPINPARPETRPVSSQWLRLANTLERVTTNGTDQFVDALEFFRVGLLPIEIVSPGVCMMYRNLYVKGLPRLKLGNEKDLLCA